MFLSKEGECLSFGIFFILGYCYCPIQNNFKFNLYTTNGFILKNIYKSILSLFYPWILLLSAAECRIILNLMCTPLMDFFSRMMDVPDFKM